MQRTSLSERVPVILLLCLAFASVAGAAERMTVIAYYNMTKGDEEQIKLVDGKWKAFVRNEPVDMAVADIANGYLEFEDSGTGGGKERVSAALFMTRDKAPMLAVLRIADTFGQCPDTAYRLTTYTLRQGKLAEAKDVVPGVSFETFIKKGYNLKKGAPHPVPDRDYRVGYKLPQKGTTVEAFLDIETAACGLAVFGEQMSPAQRDAYKEFLQNVSKETMKLKWNKITARFDLPPGVAAAAVPAGSAQPGYSDHPAKEQFSGKPAAPDLSSDPDAKRFASVLTEGTKSGPNFAGTYTLVQWGCGPGCQSFVIVNAKNGSIHTPRFSAERGLCFRKDSSLLIVDPVTKDIVGTGDIPSRYVTKYYLWDGKVLNQIAEGRSVMQDENCR